MPIRFPCVDCTKRLSIGRRKAGSFFTCPLCGCGQFVPTDPGLIVETGQRRDDFLLPLDDDPSESAAPLPDPASPPWGCEGKEVGGNISPAGLATLPSGIPPAAAPPLTGLPQPPAASTPSADLPLLPASPLTLPHPAAPRFIVAGSLLVFL